jgi:hypothetical protein
MPVPSACGRALARDRRAGRNSREPGPGACGLRPNIPLIAKLGVAAGCAANLVIPASGATCGNPAARVVLGPGFPARPLRLAGMRSVESSASTTNVIPPKDGTECTGPLLMWRANPAAATSDCNRTCVSIWPGSRPIPFRTRTCERRRDDVRGEHRDLKIVLSRGTAYPRSLGVSGIQRSS